MKNNNINKMTDLLINYIDKDIKNNKIDVYYSCVNGRYNIHYSYLKNGIDVTILLSLEIEESEYYKDIEEYIEEYVENVLRQKKLKQKIKKLKNNIKER